MATAKLVVTSEPPTRYGASGTAPARDECGHRRNGMAEGTGFLLGKILGRACPLVRTNAEVIPHPHGKAVGQQVGKTDDEDGPGGERASGNARDDRERRDDPIVSAVDQVPEIVTRDLGGPGGFTMQRNTHDVSFTC